MSAERLGSHYLKIGSSVIQVRFNRTEKTKRLGSNDLNFFHLIRFQKMFNVCLVDVIWYPGLLQRINKNSKSRRMLTAFPGSVARAARNAAILSVVPVHTTQSFGKPARVYCKRCFRTWAASHSDKIHVQQNNVKNPSNQHSSIQYFKRNKHGLQGSHNIMCCSVRWILEHSHFSN